MPRTKTQTTAYLMRETDLILDNEPKKYVLRIRDLPENQKPREKLIHQGPSSLSSTELLAILLSPGTKSEEILTMSSRIFKEYGEKVLQNQKNPLALEKDLNIPITKACQIVACFELGRRFFQKNQGGSIFIRTAKEAFTHLKEMGKLPKEHLRGLYLNSHFQLIHDETISVGTLTSNIIHPREVFRPAIEFSAAAVIIAHNHPSGNPTATKDDIEITAQLIKAGQILGIDLLDHLIITKETFSLVPLPKTKS